MCVIGGVVKGSVLPKETPGHLSLLLPLAAPLSSALHSSLHFSHLIHSRLILPLPSVLSLGVSLPSSSFSISKLHVSLSCFYVSLTLLIPFFSGLSPFCLSLTFSQPEHVSLVFSQVHSLVSSK